MLNPDKRFRVEGSHWVSPVNFDDEVVDQLDFPTPLGLIDSTLRKANYTAGSTTTIDGFLRIAAALDEAGVRDESLNLDWWGDDEPNRRELELVREVLRGGFTFTCNVFADTLLGNGQAPLRVDPRSTVDLLAGLGATVIAPGIVEAPDPESEARQLQQLTQVVDYAHECGLAVTITLAQAGRRDFESMVRAANNAIGLGVTRLDLMDSTSSLGPEAMRVFVRRLRGRLDRPVPLTMHVHDDFGLGTAGAIAAAGAGAGPDVSVNSVSYRCGFPPLEEVVLSLEVLYGVDTGIRVDRLQSLSDLVARETGIALPALKPVTGGYAYLKSTTMDVLASLRDGVRTFPPISGCVHADVIGADVRWVWDRLSTRAMVRQLGSNLGLQLSEVEVEAVYAALNDAIDAITTYPKWLEPQQAEQLARATVAATRTAALVAATADQGAPERSIGLGRFNEASDGVARDLLLSCSPWKPVVEELLGARPFASAEQLDAAVAAAISGLPASELPAILSLYPQIGVDLGDSNQAARWSRAEEAGIHGTDGSSREELVSLSDEYRRRFGYTYLVSASGLSAEQVRADLEGRLDAQPAVELECARTHLSTISRSRAQRMLWELGSQP
jgi:D-citramalate synthase